VITWQEQLAWMEVVATRFPHHGGQPIEMYRRGKRGRRRLRPAKTLAMRVAASAALRHGEQALIDRDRRRALAPHQVYEVRVRALGLERDEPLAAEYGVSQSSVTRAVDGDTYRDVPFPIRITHPDVPMRMFYPYRGAVAILASASIEQEPIITIQPHVPQLRIASILRLLDQRYPDQPAARHPHTPSRPPGDAATPRPTPTDWVRDWLVIPEEPTRPTEAADAEARARWQERRRRSG
jgi:hypothetical protein